jgi:competence protein ComEA
LTRPAAIDSPIERKEKSMKTRIVLSLMAVVLAAVTFAGAGEETSGVVNINTASAEQLQLLPRVGPALAGRIIEFREENGSYRTVDEIVAVKGIGEKSFEKLEPFIVTSGETTLTEKVSLPRSAGSSDAADQ